MELKRRTRGTTTYKSFAPFCRLEDYYRHVMVYLPLGASAVGLGVIVLMALIDWRNEMSQTPVSLWLYIEHSKYGGFPDIRVVLLLEFFVFVLAISTV